MSIMLKITIINWLVLITAVAANHLLDERIDELARRVKGGSELIASWIIGSLLLIPAWAIYLVVIA